MSAASSTVPDAQGRFGPFGGQYVPETLMHALGEVKHEKPVGEGRITFARSTIRRSGRIRGAGFRRDRIGSRAGRRHPERLTGCGTPLTM